MSNINELRDLAIQVDRILKQELERMHIKYDKAEARIYNVRSVGVQGDFRTYTYPAEVKIEHEGKIVWNPKLAEALSNRITNEIRKINRVVYVTKEK